MIAHHRPRPIASVLLAVLLLGAGFASSGCAGGGAKPGLMDSIPQAGLTERELRALVDEAALVAMTLVEQTASQIEWETDDAAVRRQLLIWQIRFNEECLRATSHDDEMASLLGLWGLAVQMRNYFDQGPGRDAFGPAETGPVETSELIIESVHGIARDLGGDEFAAGEAEAVEAFARAHPITGPRMVRMSAAPLMAAITTEKRRGGLDAVMSVDEGVTRIGDRLSTMTRQLPKQIAWQVDHLLEQRLRDLGVSDLGPKLDHLLASLDELPDVVTEQREAIIVAVREEREAIVAAIREEREAIVAEADRLRLDSHDRVDATVAEITARIDTALAGALEALGAERAEITAAVEAALDAALADVERQRSESFDRIEALASLTVRDGTVGAEEIVDRLFQRGLILLALALVGFLVVGLILRRRPATSGPA